jgi:hypothetical protein
LGGGEHTSYIGVIHCVFDQIPNLQNCFATPKKNLGEERASDRKTPAAKSLYRSIFKKGRHLGLEPISYLVHGSGYGIATSTRLQALTPAITVNLPSQHGQKHLPVPQSPVFLYTNLFFSLHFFYFYNKFRRF